MNYITYDEYVSFGGTCDEIAFNRNIARVCSVIDNATHNRIKFMSAVPTNVKYCCRDLIDYYHTNANVTEKEVSSRSETAGDVSQSVSYNSKTVADTSDDTHNIICDYLLSEVNDSGVPLLYRGAMG